MVRRCLIYIYIYTHIGNRTSSNNDNNNNDDHKNVDMYLADIYQFIHTHIDIYIYILYYIQILYHATDRKNAADSWRSRHGTILRVAGVVHDSLERPWVQHRMRGNSNNNYSNK